MAKRLLHMLLFILASMTIILILVIPVVFFNTSDAREVRSLVAKQTIAPQRLFIASWRNIKSLYVDPSMNHQDWTRWKYRYLKHIKTDEDVAIAVNTMLASLDDPHSEFFDKKKYNLQDTYIRENKDGRDSIFKSPSGTTVQMKVIAGIVQEAVVTVGSKYYENPKKGDMILSINNYPLKGMEINSAVKLIRGTSSFSKVEILRNNKLMTLSLVKGSMSIDKLTYRIIDNNIVYISIFSLMGDKAPSEFNKIIKNNKNANGYIIDLRGDVGGLFLNAMYIADELIDHGNLLTIHYRDGSQYTINAQLPSEPPQKPIVVLINRKTASSSEILAGTLRSNNKAILVGEHTYGKTSIQKIIPMPNETGINLTTAKYTFGDEKMLENGYIEPDYQVKITIKDILTGKDTQLNKAVEIIKKINKNTK